MKRMMLPATAAMITLVPGVAMAKPPTKAHARAYEHAYDQVQHKLGKRVPGRNIVKDGFSRGHAATDSETVHSMQILERMLTPTPAAAPAATATSALASGSTAGAGGVPACASESGSNYSTGASNTNASSGATGRYQILPSTAAAYGCSMATAAGQDACAQTIYEHQGASAWVGCGG